jgi:hypothetical protein
VGVRATSAAETVMRTLIAFFIAFVLPVAAG